MPPTMKAIGTEVVNVVDMESPSSYSSRRKEEMQQNLISLGCTTTSTPSLSTDSSQIQDLICVGFGPASLAIAIALHDAQQNQPLSVRLRPSISFLERQTNFAWHAGMQLPGAKMQISFLKDLATPRNPRSHFTFLNYLHAKRRLNTFINLSTFLPSRAEYEDYLRWCAAYFEADGVVSYGQEVLSVAPAPTAAGRPVAAFAVSARDVHTDTITVRIARRIVLAIGGRAVIPPPFLASHPLVFHSSTYNWRLPAALSAPEAPYHIAVIGSGQSAAEIFADLPARYPNAKVTLIIKGAALRPSDDSPFVNEVFDPERVDGIFNMKKDVREKAIRLDRGTNYGVVRLELLEVLYERLYAQRLAMERGGEEKIVIRANRKVVQTETVREGGKDRLVLTLERVVDDGVVNADTGSNEKSDVDYEQESLKVDTVFVATGYIRNAHESMLNQTRHLLPSSFQYPTAQFPVQRDYKVAFEASKVAAGAGVWLQGCNENTHGLSDTLLSILAIRGGEMVESLFGLENDGKVLKARL